MTKAIQKQQEDLACSGARKLVTSGSRRVSAQLLAVADLENVFVALVVQQGRVPPEEGSGCMLQIFRLGPAVSKLVMSAGV